MTQSQDFRVNSSSTVFVMCCVEGGAGKTLPRCSLPGHFSPVGEDKGLALTGLSWDTSAQGLQPGQGTGAGGVSLLPAAPQPSSEPAAALQEAALNFGSGRERWGQWAPGPAALISFCTSWKPCHEENRRRVNSRRQPQQQGGPGWPESLSQLKVSARF